MKVIKNSKELAKLVNEYKDLILPDQDVRIEFEPTKNEIRDIKCGDLFLKNDDELFNFNGRDFNGWSIIGWSFNGRDFKGRDFNGWSFNGRDFNGKDFKGRDFNGRKISYYSTFICCESCRCVSIKSGRINSIHIVLDGEFEFIKENNYKKQKLLDKVDEHIEQAEKLIKQVKEL